MRIKNSSSVPNDLLKKILYHVKPRGLSTSKFDVRVTNCSGILRGKCYYNGYHTPDRPHLILRVTNDESKFPYLSNHTPTKYVKLYWKQYNKGNGQFEDWHGGIHKPDPNGRKAGYIKCLLLSREEAVVHLAAHELRHLWQKNHTGRRGKVWGARGRFSERDADAYAIRKTREWRHMKNRRKDALHLSYAFWNAY